MDSLARLRSLFVQSLKWGGTAALLLWLILFLPSSVWADAPEQSSPATSEEPKYLIFWHPPQKAGELAETIGMNLVAPARH